MKMYARISSERAMKGQGGNEYLDIDILVGDKNFPEYLARLTTRIADKNGEEVYGLFDEKDNMLFSKATKGKKQKGEMYPCEQHEPGYCSKDCKYRT